MFDYIERHRIGIMTTIVIHLLLVTLFMVIQFGTLKNKKPKQEVFIDFVDPEVMQKAIEEKKEEVKKLSQQELIKDLQKEYQVGKNIAVNEADPQQSVDKMVKDIKGELNINDNRQSPEAIARQEKIEEVQKKEAVVTTKKPEYTENARGERTFYKGPTTITYFLEGRNHVYIPVPVYKCQGSGKVVMEIEVNRSGYVVSATLNKSQSQITEECLMDAANRAALTTRFNVNNSSPEKQRGRITYIFIAQ